jgi:hypothetical protein
LGLCWGDVGAMLGRCWGGVFMMHEGLTYVLSACNVGFRICFCVI